MTEKATRFLTATFSYQTVESCTIGARGSFEPRYRVVHDDSGRRRDVALDPPIHNAIRDEVTEFGHDGATFDNPIWSCVGSQSLGCTSAELR